MAFTDPDPLEQDMGILLGDMSPEQIVTYIKSYQEAYGRRLAVDGLPERAVFKGMQRIYGRETAGSIVKWVFYRYRGVYRGEVVVFTDFAKRRKWWVDKMHLELQDHLRTITHDPRVGRSEELAMAGVARLSDL